MTSEQTRQLAIEFERRILIIDPRMLYYTKLDTETIFSILNEFQLKYFQQILMTQDRIESNTDGSIKMNQLFRSLIKHHKTNTVPVRNENEPNTSVFKLPNDFFHYISSFSYLDKNVNRVNETDGEHEVVSNIHIKTKDIANLIDTVNNKGMIIRHPYVSIEKDKNGDDCIKVFSDDYSSVDGVQVTYYMIPHRFSIIGFNDEDKDGVHSYCDLPYECFNDLVDGAILLYINNYKFYLSLASNDRTRNSIEKALGDMSNPNKQTES